METPFVMRWYNGLKIRVFLGNDTSWSVFVNACYEPNEFTLLSRLLQPGMNFVDLGANDGLYTLFAAKLVEPRGSVLAVEASAREFARLTSNLNLNTLHNVQAYHAAASDRCGEANLRIAGFGHEGHNTLGEFIYDFTQLAGQEKVKLVPLDELLARAHLDRVDVMKIDIEGGEVAALNGARMALRKHAPILLLELSDAALRNQGSSSAELLQVLADFGYATYVFDTVSGRPIPGVAPSEYDPNIVAVPPYERARRLFAAASEQPV